MREQFGYAVGVIGLAPSVFYDLTPDEYYHIAEQHNKQQGRWFNNLGAVVYQAFGSAQNGKKFKPMFQVEDNPKVQQGSIRDRHEQLKYFREKGLIENNKR